MCRHAAESSTPIRKQPCFAWARGTAGNTTAEYAMLIGLVLVSVISVGQFLGKRLNTSTSTVASVLDESSPTTFDLPDSEPEELRELDLPQLLTLIQTAVCCFVVAYVLYAWRARRLAKQRRLKEAKFVDPDHLEAKRQRINAVIKKHRLDLANWVIRVEHVMDRQPAAITPVTKRSQVMAALDQSGHGVVLVLEKTGQLVGAITESELESSSASTARGILTEEVQTIDVQSHLSVAIALLQEQKLDWVAVTSNGAVCGIFSTDELMSTTLTLLQLITEIDAEHRAIMHRALDSGPMTPLAK